MSPKRSDLSCIQRTRKRIRRVANSAIGEGFFGTISRLGRLHPLGIILAGIILAVTYVGGEISVARPKR